jgi:hypothetical protein
MGWRSYGNNMVFLTRSRYAAWRGGNSEKEPGWRRDQLSLEVLASPTFWPRCDRRLTSACSPFKPSASARA